MVFLTGSVGSSAVEEMIGLAIHGKVQLFMSVVNWGEVYYSTWRDRGQHFADRISSEIARLPIEIEDAGHEATILAAELKARYRLPYADCFAASLARRRNACVVTADSDFKAVGQVLSVQFL
jgi:ribonuclease VapC